jgi:dolichol-phosphate mannosyltransferase
MDGLVVIPTYNERDSIASIIRAILEICPSIHVLVVDDNSPDETWKVVEELEGHEFNIFLLRRETKKGLGQAYVNGFRWALHKKYDFVVEMDADFSHRPSDLPRLIKALEIYDFVIGSRWVDGGGTMNWGWVRRCVSRGGSYYARAILSQPVYDWTSGFNGWKATVLKVIDLDKIKADGYSFQIELKYRALRHEFKYCEIPIMFDERRAGQSKMSFQIVLEALYRVWQMKCQ